MFYLAVIFFSFVHKCFEYEYNLQYKVQFMFCISSQTYVYDWIPLSKTEFKLCEAYVFLSFY